MKRILVIVVAVVLVATVTPMSVLAAGNPYKDVTKKSVGKKAYKAINYVYRHGGFKDVRSGKKLGINKSATYRDCLLMLGNFYEDKVPVTMNDLRNANKPANARWFCGKMVQVGKNLGVEIEWEVKSKKPLKMPLAAQYLSVFAHYDPAFQPRK